MKIAIVGGGSTYTPEFVDGLARLRRTPPVQEIVLVDPDQHRLDVVGGFARRLLSRAGHPATLSWTSDLDRAADDADIVVIQLRVGGQRARISDETIPLECGCVGQETTGAGGLAKALRTVPVILEIARRVRERAPQAWIVDFTNPVGIVTRALVDDGHPAVGLCNNAIGNQRWFAQLLDVAPDTVRLDHIGLNHLTWECGVHVNGTDVLPALLGQHGDRIAGELELSRRLLDVLGVIPSGYLRYFYSHDAVVRQQRRSGTRGQRVAVIEKDLLDYYADPSRDSKPELLTSRGGAYYSDAAIGLIASLTSDDGRVHVADVRNAGTLPFLPDEAVVEVPCQVDQRGAHPAGDWQRSLPEELAALITRVAAYEELAVQAALLGGSDRVFRALLAHPLIGQADYAHELADRLIAANAAYLAWAGESGR